MTESQPCLDIAGNESNNQEARINSMIKEFLELKERIRKRQETRDSWILISEALSINIWSRQIRYIELLKQEADLRVIINDTTKLIDDKEQISEMMANKRFALFWKQRDQIRAKCSVYGHKLSEAHANFSTENLCNDLRKLDGECKDICSKISVLEDQLRVHETRCVLNNLSSDRDCHEIVKINTILANVKQDNSNKSLEIAVARNILAELRNKIKQETMMLENMSSK